jgi:hypothetical protein
MIALTLGSRPLAGGLLELHRDWAVIGLAANEFRYTFERRRTSPLGPQRRTVTPR